MNKTGQPCIKSHPQKISSIDSVHWLSKNCTDRSFQTCLAVWTKSTTVFFETLMAILQSYNQCPRCWDNSAGSQRVATACGTWLGWPCHLHGVQIQFNQKVLAYISHTGLRNSEKITKNQSSLHATARWCGWVDHRQCFPVYSQTGQHYFRKSSLELKMISL